MNNNPLPENFWTEHQYNVGMGDGKEIKCFGHRITNKKMMDKLLQKSLQGVMATTAKEMCNLEQKIKMQTKSPQASVLREVQLPSTKKEVKQEVINLEDAINKFGDVAKENLPKITKKILDQRITPVPSEEPVPVLSSNDYKIAMTNSLAKTQSALSDVANNASEGISHAGDTLKSLALAQSTSARDAVTSRFDSLRNATKEQASKLYNQIQGIFATPTVQQVPVSQGGGKRTRRRGRKRKRRKTKHKRKKKRSTRKRKKRTRRRR